MRVQVAASKALALSVIARFTRSPSRTELSQHGSPCGYALSLPCGGTGIFVLPDFPNMQRDGGRIRRNARNLFAPAKKIPDNAANMQ